MYTDDEIEEIYNSVLLDTLELTHIELLPYKEILSYFLDRAMLFDSLPTKSNKDNRKESCKFINKLIKICKKIDDNKLGMIDKEFLSIFKCINAPYDKSCLYYFSSFVIPKDFAKEHYEIYLTCFHTQFVFYCRNRVYLNSNIPKFNNYNKFIDVLYQLFYINHTNYGIPATLYNVNKGIYSTFYNYFISYFYANDYSEDQIRNVIIKIQNNYSYYEDLINMNIGKRISNKVYYFIERIVEDMNMPKKIII